MHKFLAALAVAGAIVVTSNAGSFSAHAADQINIAICAAIGTKRQRR